MNHTHDKKAYCRQYGKEVRFFARPKQRGRKINREPVYIGSVNGITGVILGWAWMKIGGWIA